MSKLKNIIAIIPARGGSKGLPNKNILSLLGKPLINWTIEAALTSKLIDQVFVSTEDKKIAKLSKKCGANIITRPFNLATDTATSDDVILHAINELSKSDIAFDYICLLQPTSPLRTSKHIDEALTILKNKPIKSIMSVYQPDLNIAKAFKTENDGTLSGLISKDAPFMPRQQLPNFYIPNGAIYIFDVNEFLICNQIPREGIVPYIMHNDDSFDIDDQKDFDLVEKKLKGVRND